MDVVGLSVGEGEDALIDGFEVRDHPVVVGGLLVVVVGGGDPDAEARRARDLIHHLRRGDEGLRGHDVGDDGGTAAAIAFDEHDVGAELGGGESGFVAAGASADDDDAICCGFKFFVHGSILSNRRGLGE